VGVAALVSWFVTAFIGLYLLAFTMFTLTLLTVLGVGGS
jgi:hypothetical protein